MSIFFCLVVGTMRSSSYFSVVPRSLKSNKLSGISFLTASVLCSSLIAEPVLELVRLGDERPQDVVELLHVFGSISFTDVAD